MSDSFLMVVTVVTEEATVLEAFCLPGDVPTTMVWNYGPNGEVADKLGAVYKVTIEDTSVEVEV